jgi:FkbM family methyltransferase
MSQQFAPGTVLASLAALWSRGQRFASAIDIGSADGHFGVLLYEVGIFRGCRMLNIDANATYRDSLETIRQAIGAEYRLCAVGERRGTIAMTRSVHSYWDSPLPPDQPYWRTIHGQVGEQVAVECRTLDDIAAELALPGPYFLKLDIQGGEVAALRGATAVLAATDVIVVEAQAHDFGAIHDCIAAAGFDLYDVTQVERTADGRLGWFYPIYLSRRRAALNPYELWSAEDTPKVVAAQHEQRARAQAAIAASLARLRSAGLAR